MAPAAALVWSTAGRFAVWSTVVTARFGPSGSALEFTTRFGPSNVANPASGSALSRSGPDTADALFRNLRKGFGLPTFERSIPRGAGVNPCPCPQWRCGHGDTGEAAASCSAVLLVFTLLQGSRVRYPLSGPARYNFREATEFSKEIGWVRLRPDDGVFGVGADGEHAKARAKAKCGGSSLRSE